MTYIDELCQDIRNLTALVNKRETELTDQTLEVSRLGGVIDDAGFIHSDLTAEIARLKVHSTNQTEVSNNQLILLKEYRSQVLLLTAQKMTLEKETNHQIDYVQSLEKQIARQDEQIRDLRDSTHSAEHVQILEQRLDNLQSRNSQRGNRITSQDKEIADLEGKLLSCGLLMKAGTMALEHEKERRDHMDEIMRDLKGTLSLRERDIRELKDSYCSPGYVELMEQRLKDNSVLGLNRANQIASLQNEVVDLKIQITQVTADFEIAEANCECIR